jgi:hypothetical protein
LLIKKINHIIANIILTNFNKMKTKKIPPIIQIAAWLLSLIVFAVGFWHTHLGLKQMNVFGSEYGSIAIAAIVLILILITYWFAVNGNKVALIFYIICGFFVFIFNLNYFYPAYMGRNLVNEESKNLNETLQTFANSARSSSISSKESAKLTSAKALIDGILNEITQSGSTSGLGSVAKGKINEFKNIYREVTGSDVNLETSGGIGRTKSDRDLISAKMASSLGSAYQTMRSKYISGDNALSVAKGIDKLDSIQKSYKPILDSIPLDKSDIPLDSVKSSPQINSLISLVKEINEATSLINKGSGKDKFPTLDEKKLPSTQFLGQIENTLTTVKDRINKISTWSIILICLFIDLLVPLAIYFLLKKDDEEEESTRLRGKNIPTQF